MGDSLVGSVVGGHRIVRVLGRGGMGVVYEAVELALERTVALKVIAPELTGDRGFRERFVVESRMAASIDHPNVLPIFGAGEDADTLFLAMRFVPGDDLGTIVRRDGPMTPERASSIIEQVAAALDAAHGQRLVHRDVKPANVLVDGGDHAYLTDFGLVKDLAAGDGRTRTGMVLGTPDYLAPEQIRGEPLGPWTDIYALGCVFFFALTGRVVFALDGTEAKLWAHLSEPPPSVSAAGERVAETLDGVVRRALAKSPGERFGSASALAAAARVAVADQAPGVAGSAAAARGPLAGRMRELARLRELWAAVRRDRVGRLAIVTGASGIGKTRLVAEFAAEAQEHDGDVLDVSAGGSIEALMAKARRAERPTLLVADDLDRAARELQAAVAGLPLATVPVLVLATRTDGQALRRLRTDASLRLEVLGIEAIGEIARLYASDEGAGQVPAARLLAASGGVPELAHRLAGDWTRRAAAGRVAEAATRAASERREWGQAQSELAGNVIELQAVHGRAGARAGGPDPGDAFLTCPFKGLAAFGFDDAPYFFGREGLVAELVARSVGAPLLGIVGASGSGKSSLLRAGLLPALAAGVLPGSERWARVLMRPGEHPVAELERAIGGVAGERRVVLAVDQFEETFTACRDESERRAFIMALVRAAHDRAGGCVVILAVRGDFYARCAAYRELSGPLAANHLLVGAMREDELRHAVAAPAERAGLRIEPDLIDALVADVEGEPGALPLLSTALLELWRERDGRWLRLASYEHAGGVGGAVARLAESALGALAPDEQVAARRVLLRLAGEGSGDAVVGRRLALAEFGNPGRDEPARVVAVLADRRLVTISAGTVEVAHEALLREWPRLRDWLEDDADNRRLHRHLTDAARDWDAEGRDPGDLYRGARLASAREWRTAHEHDLNHSERAFLNASEAAERDELDTAKRRTRRLRALALGLAVLVVLAGASALLAVRQGQRAQSERRSAISRSLATQALASLDENVDLAALLSLEAYRTEPTIEARNAVLTTLPSLERADGALRTGRTHSVAFSPDGKTLVSAGSDGTMRLWDLAMRRPLGRPLTGHDGRVWDVAFSPDGTTLASTGEDGFLALWDVARRQSLGQAPTGQTHYISTVAFSPDGTTLASGIAANGVQLWDVAKRRPDGRPLQGHTEYVSTVAFSPDGMTLASAGADNTVRLWDVGTRRPLGQPLTGHSGTVLSVAFSPDGMTLASAGMDKTVRLWDVATRRPLGQPLTGHSGSVSRAAFSPDGVMLASAGMDKTVRLWDVATRRPLGQPLRGHVDGVEGVAFSPDGTMLASASPDGTVRLWNLARPLLGQPLTGHTRAVSAVAFTPNSRTLASAGADRTVRLWNVAARRPLGQPLQGHTGPVSAVAFSPDGLTLASADEDWRLRVWDIAARRPLARPLIGQVGPVTALAFSRDGTTLTSAGRDNGTLRRWDVVARRLKGQPFRIGRLAAVAFAADGNEIASGGEADGTVRRWDVTARGPLGRPLRGHTATVMALAFKPNDSTLASAGDDGTVRLWDIAASRPLGQPLTGHAGTVLALAFSPDGTTLASAGQDETVRLWDVATRRLLGQPLTGHTGAISALAFSPDGTALASGGGDRTVRLWQSILWSNDWSALRSRVCASVRHSLSPAEWTEFLPGEPYHATCRPS